MPDFDHTGIWATEDGAVRKLLLPNGRYMVLLGHGVEPYQGDYIIVDERIEYLSDDGRQGAGLFEDGVLHSGTGATFYPEDFAEAAAA
jgi:hypothetical protein